MHDGNHAILFARTFLVVRVLLSVLVLATVSCAPKDRNRIADESAKAISHARNALSLAWDSVTAEADKLSQRSSKSDLEAARKRVQDLQEEFAKSRLATEIDRLRAKALDQHSERLDSAIKFQEAKAAWDQLLEKAKAQTESAKRTTEDIAAKLRESDSEFRDLDQKLKAAERAYVEATNRLKETLAEERLAAPK